MPKYMDVLALWNRQKRLFSGQKSPIYRDLSIQGFAPNQKGYLSIIAQRAALLEPFHNRRRSFENQITFAPLAQLDRAHAS